MASQETKYDSSGLLNSSFYSSDTINALDHSRTFRHSLVLKELSDSSLNMALRLGGSTDAGDGGYDSTEGEVRTSFVPGEIMTKNMSNSPSLSALAEILNDKAKRAEKKMKLKMGLEASTIMEGNEEEEEVEEKQEKEGDSDEEKVENREESKVEKNSLRQDDNTNDISGTKPGSYRNTDVSQPQIGPLNQEPKLTNESNIKISERETDVQDVQSTTYYLETESTADFDASFHTALELGNDINESKESSEPSMQLNRPVVRPTVSHDIQHGEALVHKIVSGPKIQNRTATQEGLHSQHLETYQKPPQLPQKPQAFSSHQIARPQTSTGRLEHHAITNNDKTARRQRASSLGNLVPKDRIVHTQNITRRESSEGAVPEDLSVKKKRGIFSFLKKKKGNETPNGSQVSLPYSSRTNSSVHSFSSSIDSKKAPVKSVSSSSIFNTFRRKAPSHEKQSDNQTSNITTRKAKKWIPSDGRDTRSTSSNMVSSVADAKASTPVTPSDEHLSARNNNKRSTLDYGSGSESTEAKLHETKGSKRNPTPLNFELQLNHKENVPVQTLAPTPIKTPIQPPARAEAQNQTSSTVQPAAQISTPVLVPNQGPLSDSANFGSTPMSQTTTRSKRRDSGEVFFPKSLDADEVDSIIQIERNRSIRSLNNAANRRPFDALSEKAENDGMIVMEASDAVLSTPDLGKSPANSILKNGRFASYDDVESDSLMSPDGHFETYETRSASVRANSGISSLNVSAGGSPGVTNSYSTKSIEEKLNKLGEHYSNGTEDESSAHNRPEYIENIDEDANDDELMGDIMEFAQLIDFGNEIDFGEGDVNSDAYYGFASGQNTFITDKSQLNNNSNWNKVDKQNPLDRSTSLSNVKNVREFSEDIQNAVNSSKADPAGLGLNFASSPTDNDDDDSDYREFVEDGRQAKKHLIVLSDGISPERPGVYDDFENEDFNQLSSEPPAPIQEEIHMGTPELSPNMNRYIEESMARPISMSFKGLINEHSGHGDNLSEKDEYSVTENEATVGRRVKFSSKVLLYETYSEFEYDRNPDISTCNQLTPQLAQMIKAELNELKSTMEVHEESRCYTQFF